MPRGSLYGERETVSPPWVCAICGGDIHWGNEGSLIALDDLSYWFIVHKQCDPDCGPWHPLFSFVGKRGEKNFNSMERGGAFADLNGQTVDEIRAMTLRNFTVSAPRKVIAPKVTNTKQPSQRISKPVKDSLALRFRILKRDGYRCQLCGRSAADGVKLEIDHKIPRARGGSNHPDNLWTLCFACNRGKGTQEL